MSARLLEAPLLVVVGSGGVGKTTLASALALESARLGARTLVMTFDPSLRLRDALGVGREAGDQPVRVPTATQATLDAALLDAKRTFDRIVRRYAPDEAATQRILTNRFYRDLAGSLAGILEYMAMERLFEVQAEGVYDRIILDTPPTRQALDFLEAPDRIVNFLDSRAVHWAAHPWWEEGGGFTSLPVRLATRGARELADRIIGRRFLEDVVEFIRAFIPLFDGFRTRAEEVHRLLRDPGTRFLMVLGPGPDRIPDAMYFLRKLKEAGHHLGPMIVNQVHPCVPERDQRDGPEGSGLHLLRHLGDRDQEGLRQLRALFPAGEPLLSVPLEARPPTHLSELVQLGKRLTESQVVR